tara:strand:- start:349 stop:936 length:588 start_codon:yes stop_codon:yes gene_type:complete
MSGYVYLIRNKDLHKIGITENLEQRMKQLKPDAIVSTLETENFESLEKELHKRYKDVRIPQTEYFRLNDSQIADCTERLSGNFEQIQRKRNIRNWIIGLVLSVVLIFLGFKYLSGLPEDQLDEGLWGVGLGIAGILFGLSSFFGASGRKKGEDKAYGVLISLAGLLLFFYQGLINFLPPTISQSVKEWINRMVDL